MPVFNKLISQTPQDFGGALKVSGFYVANQQEGSPSREPVPYDGSLALFSGGSGIAPDVRVASGEFYVQDPLVKWNLVNPSNDLVFDPEDLYALSAFKGFEINLRSETGFYIGNLETGYKQNQIQLSTAAITERFDLHDLPASNDDPLAVNKRRFQLEVISTDYYDRTDTGIYFLQCPSPDVTGIDLSIGQEIGFNIKSTKVSGLKNVSIFGATIEGFNIDLESGVEPPDVEVRFNLGEYSQNSLDVSFLPPADSGFYYAAVIEDNFGTGAAYYYPSSVKPYNMDPLLFNIEASGLDGRVLAIRDSFNKYIDTNVVAKINRDVGANNALYEVRVVESGTDFDKNDYFNVSNPQVGGVSTFVHGTGSGRLDKRFFTLNRTLQDYAYSGEAATPIFSPYQTTGIQWLDHTLILDNDANMPAGFATGQASVYEVAIAAGNTTKPKIFWGGEFNTGSSEFEFPGGGGLISGNVYSGTYLTAYEGGEWGSSEGNASSEESNIGIGAQITGQTGVLVATNYSGFMVPEYEPHFIYPVNTYADYEFRIRTIGNGDASPFSDPLKFGSGDIIASITGAGYPTGLFNGNTNSGVAAYNADQDNLVISQYVTLDDAGIPVQIEKPGTAGSPTDLLLLKSTTSKRPAIQFSEIGSDEGGMSLEYYGPGDAFHINQQGSAANPLFIFENDGDAFFKQNTLISGSLTVETLTAKTAETGYLVVDSNNKVFTQVGTAGSQGPAGPQGPQGGAGPLGPQGVQGVIGPQGDTGAQGVQGVIGPQGDVGAQGVQGVIGPQGDTGAQGVQGVIGPQGDVGAQGVQGVIGPQGDTGAQGVQGVIGPQGDVGAQGVQGVIGPQGDSGVQGVIGPQGVQGVIGPQGDTGDSFWTRTSTTIHPSTITDNVGIGVQSADGSRLYVEAENTFTDDKPTVKIYHRNNPDQGNNRVAALEVNVGASDADLFHHGYVSLYQHFSGAAANSPILYLSSNSYNSSTNHRQWWGLQALADTSATGDRLAFTCDLSSTNPTASPVHIMSLQTDGNVGIGVTAPDQLLHLNKASGTTIVKTEVAANSTVGFEIKKTGSGGGATNQNWRIVDGQTVNGVLEFYDVTNTATRMAIKGDGNVGIGTAAPATIFHIHTDSASAQEIFFDNDGVGPVGITFRTDFATDAGLANFIRFDAADDGGNNTRYSTIESFIVDNTDTEEDGRLTFSTMVEGTDTETMHIVGGSVGIGTTTPEEILNLESSGAVTPGLLHDLYSTTDSRFPYLGLRKSGSNTAGTLAPTADGEILGKVVFKGVDSGSSYFRESASIAALGDGAPDADTQPGKLQFSTSDTSSNQVRMTILNDGNVGIGTSVPAGKLEIIGSNGTVSGTPDGDAEELVIRNNDRAGIQILSADNAYGSLIFGSASDINGANIFYAPASTLLTIGTQVADGEIALRAANGAEAVRIDAAGNVGIGTDAPEGLLSFKAAESDTPKIRFQNQHSVTTDAAISTYDDANGTTILIGSNLYIAADGSTARYNTGEESAGFRADRGGLLQFFTGETGATASERIRVLADGNVGIGTDAAGTILHIKQDDAVGPTISLTNNSKTSYINLWGATGGGTDRTNQFEINAVNTGYGITLASTDYVRFKTNGIAASDEAMRINADGNVGIGTTSPAVKLEVSAGNVRLTDDRYVEWGGTKARVGGSNAGDYVFFLTDNEDRMRIISDGNVGIGTAAPTGKFQVHTDGSGIKVLNEDVTGQLFEVYGNNGSLLTVSDDLSDSLLRVNDAAGLPVFEVFANDTVIAGQYGQNDLVVSGNRVGIGTAAPSGTLHVEGTTYLKDVTTNSSATEFLVLGADNIIEKKTGGGGAQGPQGSTGPQGVQGVIGPSGGTGPQGVQGVIGPQGDVGAQGVQGVIGPQGDVGAQGVQGVIGPQGDTGAQGVQGVIGPQGDTGAQGVQGVIGPQGDTGAQGVQGVIGPQGNQGGTGPVGPQGVQGATGDSFWTQNSGDIYPTTITDNVGIGTSSPESALTVAHNTAHQAIFRTAQTTATERAGGGFSSLGHATATSRYARLFLDADGANFSSTDYFTIEKFGNSGEVKLLQYSNANMSFLVNTSTQAMTIQNDGNVGIGVSSPGAKLESLITSGGEKGLRLNSNFAGGNTVDFIPAIVGVSNAGFSIALAGTNRLIINSSGNVGLGTDTPDNKVHIQESALSGRPASNTNTSLTIEQASDTGIQFFSATQTQIRFGDAASTAAGAIIYEHGDDNFKLNYTDHLTINGSAGEKVRFLNNGNVGIGTVAPTGKLQVHNDGSGIKVLNEDVTGQLFEIYGDNGSLLTVSDDLSDSLLRVNDAAGLPVFEVFANDTVIAGQYGQNDLVVTGNRVGVGTAAPSGTFHVEGNMYLKDAVTNGSATEFLVLGADNVVEKRTGGSQGSQGAQGVQGVIGPTGPQGVQGVIGPQGPTGPQGSTGPQGVQGVIGPQGNQGGTGPVGPQGVQGVIGPQGVQGTTGDSFWSRSSGDVTLATTSDNVGIGTTPTYSLSVAARTANSSTGTMFVNAALNGSGKGIVITSNTRTTSDNDVGALEIINRGGGNTLFATVAGNVGIGDTSPGNKLVVNGTSRFLDTMYFASTARGLISWGSMGGGTGFGMQAASGNGLSLGANATWDYLVIDTGGNVGVGTASPSYKLEVSGSFAATTKSFLIDHPTKENMRLQYGALEGPENGVYVRGKSNYKIIDLPEYWTHLVDEESITVQLTPIGRHQHLFVEKIRNNQVFINTVRLTERPHYYYIIHAERKDVDKLEVEIKA